MSHVLVVPKTIFTVRSPFSLFVVRIYVGAKRAGILKPFQTICTFFFKTLFMSIPDMSFQIVNIGKGLVAGLTLINWDRDTYTNWQALEIRIMMAMCLWLMGCQRVFVLVKSFTDFTLKWLWFMMYGHFMAMSGSRSGKSLSTKSAFDIFFNILIRCSAWRKHDS